MFEEAEIALSKAAAPDGTIRDPLLYVQCLVKRGQVHKAAELAVKYVVNDKVPAATAPQLAELTAVRAGDRRGSSGGEVEHTAAAEPASSRQP
jgi:hypothetical protein